MTKRMCVYKYKEHYVMHPICLSDGLWVDCLPSSTIDINSKPTRLGEAVAKTLGDSKTDIPRIEPKDAAKVAPKLLGLRTWSALMKSGAISCTVTQEDGRIKIMPLKNMGPRGGFQPLEGGIRTNAPTTVLVISDQASPQEIGETLLKALSMSR